MFQTPADQKVIDKTESSRKTEEALKSNSCEKSKMKIIKRREIFVGDLNEIVENKTTLDYDALNKEFLASNIELYSAIDNSRWCNKYQDDM